MVALINNNYGYYIIIIIYGNSVVPIRQLFNIYLKVERNPKNGFSEEIDSD